ncbi:hypothetical protein F5883DRAFT_170880 [Diaporthe sp. PMI_573]|nr:hypothetical protein F5883DRAFT_170880 [Diaporthaceae sp. PMI_573]
MKSVDMDARDTNIGPVPKRGFSARLGTFIYTTKLLYFSILSLANTSPNVSFDSRHNATTHRPWHKHLGIMGHGNGCNIIWARLFYSITVSEALTCPCFIRPGYSWPITKLLLAPCVGLGLSYFVVAPTMRSMREAFVRFWFGREIQGGGEGVQVNWTDEIRKGRPGWAFF